MALQALEERQHVLGHEHPDTNHSMAVFSSQPAKQGQNESAASPALADIFCSGVPRLSHLHKAFTRFCGLFAVAATTVKRWRPR